MRWRFLQDGKEKDRVDDPKKLDNQCEYVDFRDGALWHRTTSLHGSLCT